MPTGKVNLTWLASRLTAKDLEVLAKLRAENPRLAKLRAHRDKLVKTIAKLDREIAAATKDEASKKRGPKPGKRMAKKSVAASAVPAVKKRRGRPAKQAK